MPIELGAMAANALEKTGEAVAKETIRETTEAAKGLADFGKTGLESGAEHVDFGKTGLEIGTDHVDFGKTGLETGAEHDIFGKYVIDSTESVFEPFRIDRERFLRETAKSEVDEKAKEAVEIMQLPETNVLLQELQNGEFRELKDKFWDDKKYYSRLHGCYRSNSNCYCFACDFPENPITGEDWPARLNPGELSGATRVELERDYSDPIICGDVEGAKNGLQKWIREDLAKVGKELVEVDADYVPKDGESMIYMCGCSSGFGRGDYHFMRKGNYGTWYHKPGVTEPLDRDPITGERIFNPEETAKSGDVCYDMNLGYYAIRNK